jgi:ketosteroid isomerase-like protein
VERSWVEGGDAGRIGPIRVRCCGLGGRYDVSEKVRRYQAAIAAMDIEALGELRHRDYVCSYPQSGERFRGHENWARAHQDYASHFPRDDDADVTVKEDEQKVEVTGTASPIMFFSAPVVQISETGDLVTMEGKGTWPDGKIYNWVRILEYRDGLVWRECEYFAEPFEPPAWRAPFVESDPGASPS